MDSCSNRTAQAEGQNLLEQRQKSSLFKDEDVGKVMGKPLKTDEAWSTLYRFERTFLIIWDILRGRLIGTETEFKLSGLRFKDKDKFEQNGIDLDSLEKDFLDGKQREELILKTEKELKMFNALAEKQVEAIDSLKIFDADTSEDQKTRNCEKRKQIIQGVQSLLNLNDKYLKRLEESTFRVEHSDG
ncbi:unnamed protein product [Bursaphelenchus okinawaensis]|uniref:BAG domain-containing protein n=1 Tax=Bursaphelenchus okinawaensis TaxID=465554 RepID=A0A811JQK8_9BILA|nr:unnamed protein product [Bursaphelenchus okinawaensis]CAG9078067.1 unnamed protein product [Bursaphelenchus okinawaensis]